MTAHFSKKDMAIRSIRQSISGFFKLFLRACREKRIYAAVYSRIKPFVFGVIHIFHNPASGRVSIHAPERVTPGKTELPVIERIFRAYKKMKQDQIHAPSYYLPSSMWQKSLDEGYSYLTAGSEENDIDKFHYFLANFGAWQKDLGIEPIEFLRNCQKSFLKSRYLENIVFYKQLKIWEWFYNGRKHISGLSYPAHGNQSGAYIDGFFIGIGSFFNEIYGSLLSELVCDRERPVIAELGSGYGKLAYFILRDKSNFTFIDFDLPETICIAAYYLLKIYPDKKSLLYGEEDFSPDTYKKYDLIFMPSYEIPKTGSCTVDLFINKNSLGEMTKEAAKNYIFHITNSTKYFFHMNHDIVTPIFDNNERGLRGYEYPVPQDKFKLVFRYADIGHLLYKGWVDYTSDIFIYLYERKK